MSENRYQKLMNGIHTPAGLNDRVLAAARQQTAEKTAFERENAEQHLERDERSDRHKTEKQRNAEILHGHGGKIADENGHDELGRVHRLLFKKYAVIV